ncbi:cbb3-type cytochrome c oxidase subunit II [Ferriphaselus amnicola]|uniref:Cbb3-type cytochrome c oxidase subunit II n=1 Tax=Ferriphaselus amnicola TaxID=1188319 RepID=A0A2Z6G948_9PROT|nr:cytochrome-c oxidase, cbb3-type subunit II [Ferriphaselus amnicola]BBE49895.1 cbb3-type cytochrome c oxidase subunit II [Ferriphaselus amnicola]
MSDHDHIYSTKFQDSIERNTLLMFILTAVAVAVGGIVEIVPLFYLPNTGMSGGDGTFNGTQHKDTNGNVIPMDKIVWNPATSEHKTMDDWQPGDGVRPHKPLELAGRAVFIREGCFLCHSQMIRPFRDEKDRYGHYSIAEESMYDHTYQWGSKRTGPDIARVGGKYSDEWHRKHLKYPRDVVPESVMPNYFFLENAPVDGDKLAKTMEVMTKMPFNPVPKTIYTDELIAGAKASVEGKTEMDAVIAYLQSLGNHVKFEEGVNYRD